VAQLCGALFKLYGAEMKHSLPFLAQPALVPSLLLLLPASIEELEIAGPCCNAAITALQRFKILRCLRITGSASAVDWQLLPHTALSVLPAVKQLSLDYRQEPLWDGSDWVMAKYEVSKVDHVPQHTVSGLRSATNLNTLTLRCQRDNVAQALMRLPPALSEVR
jgi:hypothetical protein